MTLFRRLQGLQACLTRALALTALGLAAQAQGASADDAPAATGQPRAEEATPAVEPAPTAPEATSPANPAGTPPRRFIPTEQVSEDRAVAFPKDI